ncbi:MAG TPA: amino acid permease [Planctomycetaceae bacterium]|nr:amino acid permease [Planctomycetaceae bacterium]
MSTPVDETPRPLLSLTDAISLIVGIVIGSSIYKTAPLISQQVDTWWQGLGLWILGGVISLCGALVYAELATTYLRLGGDYNYLTRAFGPGLGFLFGWTQLFVIQTGSIGALAFVGADHLAAMGKLDPAAQPWIAIVFIAGMTAINMLGLRPGAWMQNLLTAAKLAGLVAVIAAGLCAGTATDWSVPVNPDAKRAGWPLALLLILYAYGGWNDAAFVAAEVRDVKRNIPRALLGGIGLIVVIYGLINLAYLRTLGLSGLQQSQRPAAEALGLWLGPWGEFAMNGLVAVSALGGVNGLILSVSRLHATVGADHRAFRWLGKYNREDSPTASLLLQGVITVGMVLTLATDQGREALNTVVTALGFVAIPWDRYYGGFETFYAGSAPAFWAFFLLTGIAFFILRWRDRDLPRPFRTPFSPVTPLLFIVACAWALQSAAVYAWPLLPLLAVPILLGVPVYFLTKQWDDRPPSAH